MNGAVKQSLVLVFVAVVFGLLAWRLWPDGAQARRQQRDRNLIQAVRHNDLSAATRLLGEGADPNAQTPPLSASQKAHLYFTYAARYRSVPLWSDLDVRWSPLQYGVLDGDADVVNILLLRGADVGYCDKAGDTALAMAKMRLNSSLTRPQSAVNMRRIIVLLKSAAVRPHPRRPKL